MWYPKRLQQLRTNIINRCTKPNHQAYRHYGGRGISVCAEWVDSSVAFYEWAIAAGWRPGLYIDRIDPDGDYSPNNCRFVTPSQSSVNRRKMHSRKGSSTASQYIGVRKSGNSWTVRVRIAGKNTYIGSFPTELQAARAYDKAALAAHGDVASLNFPRPNHRAKAVSVPAVPRFRRRRNGRQSGFAFAFEQATGRKL